MHRRKKRIKKLNLKKKIEEENNIEIEEENNYGITP